MTVAEKLDSLIESRGIKYTFIAGQTGMAIDAVSKALHGKRKLTADELLAICRATGIQLSELQDEEARKNA